MSKPPKLVQRPDGSTALECYDDKGKVSGYIRELPPDHPQSLDNPANKHLILEFARALGRLDAKRIFEAAKAEREKTAKLMTGIECEGEDE